MVREAKPAKKRKGIYKFAVKEDVFFKEVPIIHPFKKEFLEITDDGHVIVRGTYKNGYAWDGCTPKWNILDLWVMGIPDGRTLVDTGTPTTYHASMVHDILCQYQKEIGITRKQADDIFLHYLGDFQLRYVYTVLFACSAYI